MAKKKTISQMDDPGILENISPHDALMILRTLVEEDKQIARRIEQIGREYLGDVDLEDIASEVYSELDCLRVEDVWDQSGSTRDGYVDPYEKAWEMFEEALKPFSEELGKFRNLSMNNEAKTYCMGILKGIFRYEKESISEFKDWAVDAPEENFRSIITDFLKEQDDPEVNAEIEDFIKRSFPGW